MGDNEEPGDLLAKLEEDGAGDADKDDAEEAKRRAAAILQDAVRAIKRTNLG